MAKQEKCILTNMCMIYDHDQILVQDRLDPDWPGITFPGGHVESRESFVDSVIREIKEETGLTISHLQLCGLKQFCEDDYRYIVFLFKTHSFHGQIHSSHEGKVFWINKNELKHYHLAEGFENMIDIFENNLLIENYNWFDGHTWKSKNK
ncbi:MAG: 8-oxo-dGTP diphosphatase [Faecalibacillus sp.]